MRRLFLFAVLIFACALVARASPITHEQAKAWVIEQGPDKVADVLVAINNDLPDVTFPQTLYLLVGRDLVVTHDPGYAEVKLAPWINYRIMLPDERHKDWAPPDKSFDVALTAGVVGLALGLVGGLLVGILVH